MRWGFHRSFNESINIARADKLAGGMWAEAYRERRCTIPLTLFYEWGPGEGGRKQAYEFRGSGRRLPVGGWHLGGQSGVRSLLLDGVRPQLSLPKEERVDR